MSTAVKITRGDFTASDLRAASAKCGDGAQVRRMLALALVLEGRLGAEAATLNGMDRQTLSDWVHRFNAEGIEGLKSRKSPGREPLLTAAQKAELRERVIQGPDPAVHKVVRWRCADLRAEVARRWSVEVHESTIGAWRARFDKASTAPGASEEGCRCRGRFKKRMARPVGKRFRDASLISLRQRIRSQGITLAKMEIRTVWSS